VPVAGSEGFWEMSLRWFCGLLLVVSSGTTQADDCLSSRGLRLGSDVESRCSTMSLDGRTRSYRLYVPAHVASPAPVVFVLHGGGGSGSNIELITKHGFNRIADRDGAIVVYPDGVGRNWNDGRSDVNSPAFKEHVDDVAFLKALVEVVTASHPVDRGRVYATGMSNGGFMSYRLACDAAGTFRAVVAVVAGLSADLGPQCRPARPVSVAVMNGTEDPLVPWAGGAVSAMGIKRGETWSARRTYDRWIELDACKTRIDEPERNVAPEDGTTVVVHRAIDCAAGSQVRLYEIRGGGHNWPGGATYLGVGLVGRVSSEFDGNEEIWRFFNGVDR
jgi:polyhydroxybutyrate depolymerase